MAKDIEYFIIEAKAKIRKEITFLDFEEIIREASLQHLQELERSVRSDSSLNMGSDFSDIIDEYVNSQANKIDTLAAQMLREYQEDRKAEADQDRYDARNGL